MSTTKQEILNYKELVENLTKEIKYGTITIVIQDGKVIQINREEKYRMC